jgi:hypothetical protein
MVRVLGFLGFRDSMFAGLREEGRGGGGIDRRWAAGKAAECRRPGWWLPAVGPGPGQGRHHQRG